MESERDQSIVEALLAWIASFGRFIAWRSLRRDPEDALQDLWVRVLQFVKDGGTVRYPKAFFRIVLIRRICYLRRRKRPDALVEEVCDPRNTEGMFIDQEHARVKIDQILAISSPAEGAAVSALRKAEGDYNRAAVLLSEEKGITNPTSEEIGTRYQAFVVALTRFRKRARDVLVDDAA